MFTINDFYDIRCINDIINMNARDFEYFCKFLLDVLWFKNTYVTKYYWDWWIDIVTNFKWSKIFVQCKHWYNKYNNKKLKDYVWVTKIRELWWVMKRDWVHCWVFISLLRYSPNAKEEAKKIWIRLLWEEDIEECMTKINPNYKNRQLILWSKSKRNWFFYKFSDQESVDELDKKISKTNENLKLLLKELRLDIANKKNMPAYCVFTDKQLDEITKNRPRNLLELSRIKWLWNKKLNKYWFSILETINNNFYIA